ncbi:MAG: tyrosine--tRNA ligase [Planctomycetes bacterium]|nr:tyrosine--tRNA ligase [Planctomycetota bacterium]
MDFPPIEEQLRVIRRGVVDLVDERDLVARLEQSRASGKPLRVKLGIDPSSPDIHLGHTVVLRKLRDFQRLGHTAIVLWGTSTAMLGDPTGKNKTRPQLTREAVEANKQTYKLQVGRVLDISTAEERENCEWFDSKSFMDCVQLTGSFTVARILERDSFEKRYKAGEPISVHELVYPLMQGWDSVELEADVEIGGTDQLFNLMVGRELQRREGQKPQVCVTTPIIVGLDGTEKMSKSLGNYIGVLDEPREMFGKCMSVTDEAMRSYFELLTDVPDARIEELVAGHPRAAKVELARSITEIYHGAEAAANAVAEFDRMFQEGGLPDEIAEYEVSADQLRDGGILLAGALAVGEICGSNSDGRRLIKGGGVKVDGVGVTDERAILTSGVYLLQSGKRKFARVRVP